MQPIRTYLAVVCLCLAAHAAAQAPRFANGNLQRLAGQLQAEYGLDCTRPGTQELGQNRLVVTQDSLRRIDHIGLALFPESIVRENPSPVYRFVERYLLELYLPQEQPTPEQRLKEDNVTLRFPSNPGGSLRDDIARHLPRLDEHTSLLVLTDNHRYSVSIYRGERALFVMRFPIRYELLWGMNKVEAENGFYEALLRYRPPRATAVPPLAAAQASALQPDGDGCLVLTGDSYVIAAVNNDRFYRLAPDGTCRPVLDRTHAEESLRNLFLMPDLSAGITASVTQRMYRRRTLQFDIPLHHLLSFCRTAGCQAYVGIETCTAERVTGTVILLNPSLGYCHQLYFETDIGILDHPRRHKMSLELYAFVPTHNIGNLFDEKEK